MDRLKMKLGALSNEEALEAEASSSGTVSADENESLESQLDGSTIKKSKKEVKKKSGIPVAVLLSTRTSTN